MKDILEFFESSTGTTFTEVNADEDLLTSYLVDKSIVGDEEEMGLTDLGSAAAGTAVELPHHSQLKPEYQGMYVRYSGSCADQHWGTEATVMMAVNLAYNWWKKGYQPTMLLGDISAKTFSQTGCHSAHKTGTHLDTDLAHSLPRDPDYTLDKKKKCAVVCWFAIQLGAKRVLFSDSEVASAVNKAAADNGFNGRVVVRADHDNHFHIEMPL